MIHVTAKQGDHEVTIPNWLWASVGALLLLATGGIGTWAGTTLFDHEKRISSTEAKIDGFNATVLRIDQRVERIDEKLDRVLDKLSK